MKLAVIAVGGLKEKYYREACAEYLKRMTAMRPVEVIEIREEPVADERSPALVMKALEREGLRIIACLRSGDIAVALSPAGRMMDSPGFAETISSSGDAADSRIVFIIGSSHGLGQAVYEKCRCTLSLGPMTYPHQLARVILLEQIYRGQMISLGRLYHK